PAAMSNKDRSKLSLLVLGAGAILLGAAVLQSVLIAVPGSRNGSPKPVSAGKEAPATAKASAPISAAQNHPDHAQAEPAATVTAPEPEAKSPAPEPEVKAAAPEPETKT